jgi:hypothetical protein
MTGLSARVNIARLSFLAGEDPNDGHIRGNRICGARVGREGSPKHTGKCDATPLQCLSFSMARCAVRRSIRGGRVPIVLTQSTSREGSNSRTKCWQLEGWRPQSSEKTSSGVLRREASVNNIKDKTRCEL